MYAIAVAGRRCVARERAVGYSPGGSIAGAARKLRDGLDELAPQDLSWVSDGELGEALLAVEDAQARLAAAQARLVRAFERRDAGRADACTSVAGWLRHKTNLGPGAVKRRVKRAGILERMPALAAALADGDIAVEHVDAVAYRMVPARMDAIAEHDGTLAALARDAEPRDVAVAVQRIVDQVDADGADDPPPCASEHLRELTLHEGYAGLQDVAGTLTPLAGELLRRVRDVYDEPDPAEVPDEQRRTAGQRFHDALAAALQVALDNHPGSTAGGVKTHVVLFADLFTLLGHDALARIRPRLGESGFIDPELARHIVATTNVTVRAVLGLGPWNAVSVGRSMRTLPGWLRAASELAHRHCRAPGCDRPASWCDSDHIHPWCRGGETSLRNSAPMCAPHNQLKHEDGWDVEFDTVTGEVTWTSADRSRVIRLPAPDI